MSYLFSSTESLHPSPYSKHVSTKFLVDPWLESTSKHVAFSPFDRVMSTTQTIQKLNYTPRVSTVDLNCTSEPVESSDDFKIVVILDESGSMECIRQDMIKAINDLLMEQKQIKDRPCRFTLVKFNDDICRKIKNKDLKEISALTLDDYKPEKSTALYDAIGNTVEWFRYEKNVLMVIVTDGQENASKKYSREQVTKMLDEKQKNRNWSYVYLSNDLKTAAQGDSLGFKESAWSSNQVVDQSAFGNFCSTKLNSAISNFRKTGMSVQRQLNESARPGKTVYTKTTVFY